MATRGLVGIRYRDKDFLIYNHFDSYPEALGAKFLSEVPDWVKAKEFAPSLVSIPETRKLAGMDGLVETEFRRHMPDEVQTENPEVMYDLYRNVQGTLEPNLDGSLRFVPVANDFIYNGRFCEWAYIANLDTEFGCRRRIVRPSHFAREEHAFGGSTPPVQLR